MDSLREFYQKYDEIVRLSAYAFTGWFLSWVLFFIMLPFMVRSYGKIRGASLNYGFSWVSMIAIILGLEFGMWWCICICICICIIIRASWWRIIISWPHVRRTWIMVTQPAPRKMTPRRYRHQNSSRYRRVVIISRRGDLLKGRLTGCWNGAGWLQTAPSERFRIIGMEGKPGKIFRLK